MNNSGLPGRIKIPFASTGSKNPIPEVSTGSMVTDGLAAMDSGFPSTTLTPRSAGGVPPHGEDMNGILYAITSKLQASDAGARYPFDATFATSIGGYPNGAIVMSSDLAGEWLNTTDANTTNPEGTATANTGWVPLNFSGASTISISTANVTMTCLAAARPVIILSGALTANRFLYVPNWSKHWTIINNCTGAFSVIVSTVSGVTTASIPSGTIANVYCDGSLNVTKLQSTQLASTTQPGIVQLNNTLVSTSFTEALTAAQGKALNDKLIGVGQSWQDVKSSRSSGTTYTNNTGRPIQVHAVLHDTYNVGLTVTVGGVNIISLYYDVPPGGFYPLSFIVPNNTTYRIFWASNNGTELVTWSELR